MRHLDDGVLRRRYDEPLTLSAEEQRHYAACLDCQERFVAIAADARATAALLDAPEPRLDTVAAYRQLQGRIGAICETGHHWERRLPAGPNANDPEPAGSRRSQESLERAVLPWYRQWIERIAPMYGVNNRSLVKPVGGVLAAAAIVGALALTPVGTFAQQALNVFQPQQIAAVPITQADAQSLRALPDLSQYGTLAQSTNPTTRIVADAAAARAASGLAVSVPSSLPSGIPSTVTYGVMTQGTASFTFSAARARAEALREGRALPPMPASLDGSTLQATIGPAVVSIYSSRPLAYTDAMKDGRKLRIGPRDLTLGGVMPSLVIVQAKAPTVVSTGATVSEIEDYLLKQPGISPQLVSEIKAIGNPGSTLPVPIPVDRAMAQPVQVQGVQGLIVADNTGAGSAMIWVKGGMVYGVAGMLTQNEITMIANSLQ